MIRVVADTNVLISAFVFGGLPASFVAEAYKEAFKLVTSPVLLDELDEKLLLKFKVPVREVEINRAALEELCDVVSTVSHLSVIKADPDDDRVLECAIAGQAIVIVSGDRHLLDLQLHQGIRIVMIREFLNELLPAT